MINKSKKSLLSLNKIVTLLFTILSFLLISNTSFAADDLSLSALTLTTNPDGSQEYSVTLAFNKHRQTKLLLVLPYS